MFFSTWAGLDRTVIVGVLAYAGLVALLRLSGKRTLAKMNAFDLVVTVALGSTLATILLSKDVPLAEGVLAFALLIALHYAIAWLAVRSAAVGQLVKSEPTLLLYRGVFLPGALRRERELRARCALLAIVPLTTFRQFAFAMATGVLIDSFLVRTYLVPSLITLVGNVSFWPRRM